MSRRQWLIVIGVFCLGNVIGMVLLATTYLWATGSNAAPSEPISAPLLSYVIDTEGLQRFTIISMESEVRFILDEIDPPVDDLTGRTNQVAGEIWIDTDDPRNSRMGPVRVNMRTLSTGHIARDTALRERILMSSQDTYEFIEFVPTAIYGLPDSIVEGETVTFTVVGDMRIVDTTHSLLFDVQATLTSDNRLVGTAQTTVYRDQLGLMQSFLSDRGVSNDVRLEIDYVAERMADLE
jgi:polyisoprenoid-binding protein YceI